MINEHNRNAIDMIYGTKPVEPQVKEEPRQLGNDLDSRRKAMLDDLKQTGYRKERRDPLSKMYR